jgi:dihydroorotate dehydrogenase (fumarate)
MGPSLETTYLGLRLAHPVVASAGPLTHDLDGFRRLEDAGVSAIVMHSLFEEQITRDSLRTHHYLESGSHAYGESLTYAPEFEDYGTGPDRYLDLLAAAKDAVSVPILGSLNGITPGGWRQFAAKIGQAGADALELNLYHVPADPATSGADLEAAYLDAVREVAAAVSIPVAVKLSPFFTSPAHMARQFAAAGAAGLVLFNRFYQPDIDLDELQVVPRLVLSQNTELRLPLRWTAILFGRVDADLAITSGVHAAEDVLKGILVGANVTMMTSELLQHGLGRVAHILEAVRLWMEEREFASVGQMRGSLSHLHTASPAAFERANYLSTLQSWRPDTSLGHWPG